MDYLERSKSWIEARTANNCKRMQKAAKGVQKAVKNAESSKRRGESTGNKGTCKNSQERKRRNHDLTDIFIRRRSAAAYSETIRKAIQILRETDVTDMHHGKVSVRW